MKLETKLNKVDINLVKSLSIHIFLTFTELNTKF